jgi:GH18 family chitinase
LYRAQYEKPERHEHLAEPWPEDALYVLGHSLVTLDRNVQPVRALRSQFAPERGEGNLSMRNRLMSSQASVLVVAGLLCGACAAPATPAAEESVGTSEQALVSSPKQVVYVPLWTTVDNSKIPWDDITHINLAFAGVNSSHQCAWVDANGNASGYDTNASTIIAYKNAHYPAIKVMVSVGGWTMSQYFSESMSSTYRSGFVSSCVSLVNNIGADGLDIDWEYPTSLGAGNCPGGHTCASSSDPANYTATLTSLRSSFGTGKLITAALRGNTASDHTIAYEYQNFFSGSPRRFDFVNLMTYDYHGAWESVTGFTAPYSSVTAAVDYAVKGPNGVDDTTDGVGSANKDKIIMGMPFYGAAWANVGAPSGAGTGFSGTPLGTVAYKDAVPISTASGCSVKTPSSGDTQNRYIYCTGAANITYTSASSGTLVTQSQSGLWISFDNTSVIGSKTDYVANNNYGGVMWWAQGNDTSTNDLANTMDGKLTATASAPVSGHTYKIVGKQSNKCIDVPGSSTANGADLDLWTCHGSTNQSYVATDLGGGQWQFKNTNSGKCWDMTGNSTSTGALIEQWTCKTSGYANQVFTLTSAGAGYYTLKNVNSGLCVDITGNSQADGASVEQWTCSGGSNQAFQFQ